MSVLKEIETFDFANRAIGDYLSLCLKCKTKEEAELFLVKYRKIEPEYADQNLGYVFGYCSAEDRTKLYKLFPVNHPIFGSVFGREREGAKAK
jgi:hypothetical protein